MLLLRSNDSTVFFFEHDIVVVRSVKVEVSPCYQMFAVSPRRRYGRAP